MHASDSLEINGSPPTSTAALVPISRFGIFQFSMWFFCGFEMASQVSVLLMLSFLTPRLEIFWSLTPFQTGALSFSVFVGVVCGASTFGWVSDRKGRLMTLKFALLLEIIAISCASSVSDYYVFWICLFFSGWGCGGSMVAYSYAVEFLPLQGRGFWMNSLNCFWSFAAIILSLAAMLVFSPTIGIASYLPPWKLYIVVCLIPMLLSLFVTVILPESPRFLWVCGRLEEYDQVRATMDRVNSLCWSKCGCEKKREDQGYDEVSSDSDDEKQTIVLDASNSSPPTVEMIEVEGLASLPSSLSSSTASPSLQARLRDFIRPKVFFVLLNSCAMLMISDFIYFGVVMAAPSILSQGDFKGALGTMLTALCELPGTILAAILVGIIGRKLTSSLCYGIAGICSLLLCFWSDNLVYSTVFTCIFRGAAEGALCVVTVLVSEGLPTNVRSFGVGFAAAVGKIGGGVTSLYVKLLPFENWLAPKITFSVLGFIACVLALVHPVETKQRELTDTVQEEEEEAR